MIAKRSLSVLFLPFEYTFQSGFRSDGRQGAYVAEPQTLGPIPKTHMLSVMVYLTTPF